MKGIAILNTTLQDSMLFSSMTGTGTVDRQAGAVEVLALGSRDKLYLFPAGGVDESRLEKDVSRVKVTAAQGTTRIGNLGVRGFRV